MQRGWVGDVADLFFFSLQKDYSINIDEVGTNHPIFSFFDSPCLRHRVLHNIISPGNDMLDKMHALFAEYPEVDLGALGFPSGNWQNEPLWSTR